MFICSLYFLDIFFSVFYSKCRRFDFHDFLKHEVSTKTKTKNKQKREEKKKKRRRKNVKYNDVNKFRIATPRKKKEKKGQAVPQEC